MPSKTEKQRKMFAIALHHPEQLNKENRGVLKMTERELHDFASGPKRKKKKGD